MSFGGAGSQGSIRYAILLDSAPATQSLNTFKTAVTNLGTPTQAATRTIQQFQSSITAITAPTQTVTANMQKLVGMQGPLSAGFAKTSGAAKDMIANTNTLATGSATLGTRIKDNASKFAGLATGLSATASGALQLAAGFRDYNDAQIAVERVTRKLSLAHEALTKAQDKLNALTTKGVTSGKAYEQAQLDVQQAQAAVSIQTQLLGESQERLFDSQTQFVTSIVPTVLGAIGSIGFAFKDLGLNGTKLIGMFTTLGGGIKGALTTIGTAAGIITPASAALTGLGVAGEGANISLKALAITAGSLAVPIFATISAMKDIPDLIHFFQDKAAAEDPLKPLVDRLEARKKAIEFTLQPLNWNLGSWGTNLGKILNPQLAKDLTVELEDINNRLALLKKGIASGTTFSSGIKIFASDTVSALKPVPQSFNRIAASMLTGHQPANDYSNMLIDLNQKMFDNKTLAGEQAKALANIPPEFKTAATFTQLFGDATTVAGAAMAKFHSQQIKPVVSDLSDFEIAFRAGNTQFQDFVKSTELGAVTNKRYTDSLKQWVGSQIDINPAINLTTSELEALQTALAKSKVDAEGMSEATKILSDAFNKELTPSLQTFNSAITADKFKDFKNALKDLPGFGDFSKGAKKEFSSLLNNMRNVAKTAKEVGTDISAAILGAFEGVSSKSLGNVIKNLVKDVNQISKIDIDATKFKPITDFLNGLTKENRAAGILKVKDSLALMQDAMADGVVTAEEAKAVIAKFNEETGKIAEPVNKSAAAIQAFGVSSASARGQIDVVTGAIDALVGHAKEVKPEINVNTEPALGAIGELKRGWDKVAGQIAKKIPALKVNPNQALDMIGETKRGWDKVAGQIEKKVPKLKVNADQALDMIGEVKRGLDSLKDKTVTVTTKHVEIAQGGMHKILAHDTTIMAHKGEAVDIWPAGSSGSSNGGVTRTRSGGGGSGGNNFTFELELFDEKIVRKINARQGQARYKFGA